MSNHAQRKHARLSASARSRWSKCPASIRLSAGLPDPPSTEAAAEGTARHEWGDWCLRNGLTDASDMVGFGLGSDGDGDAFVLDADHADDASVNALTEEAAKAVNVYLDTVWKLAHPADKTLLYVEQKLDFPGMHSALGGTGDALIFNTVTRELHIVDFKNGWWIVEVERNPQLLMYAIGGWLRLKHLKPAAVVLHVVQPKDFMRPVKSWRIDMSMLLADKALLQREAEATDAPDAPCVPGTHCTFCPAAYHNTCRARREFLEEEASRGLTALQEAKEDPRKLKPEDLAGMLDKLPMVKAYAEALEKYARPLVKEGRVPGKKVVVFQLRMAWNAHRETVATELARAFPGVNPFKEPDLITPAEVETAVGKKTFKDFKQQWTTRTPFGEQIVDLSDERPPISTASAGFSPVEA